MTDQAPASESKALTLPGAMQAVADGLDRLRFWTLAQLVPSVINLVAIAAIFLVLHHLNGVAGDTKTIAEQNAEQGVDIRATLEVVRNATSPAAEAASNERLSGIVKALIAEGDCADRRARAGLPAVEPLMCRSSTPSSIYPGG